MILKYRDYRQLYFLLLVLYFIKTKIFFSRSCHLIIAVGQKSSPSSKNPESRCGLYWGNDASPHNYSNMCRTLSLPEWERESSWFSYCFSVNWHQRQDWACWLHKRFLGWRLTKCPWALKASVIYRRFNLSETHLSWEVNMSEQWDQCWIILQMSFVFWKQCV